MISGYVDKLEAANHTGLLCHIFAAVNRRPTDDPALKHYFQRRGWIPGPPPPPGPAPPPTSEPRPWAAATAAAVLVPARRCATANIGSVLLVHAVGPIAQLT